MRSRSMKLAALAALSISALAARVGAVDLLYTLESTKTLPSSDTYWDYIKMEPGSSRLYMARVKDGLTVFDVDKNEVIGTVENSIGANGPLLLPQYGRGYVAMTDGSLLSFDLKTLKAIERLPLDENGGLNSAIYDPATKRIHAIVGSRPKESTWYTLDAATGKLIGTKTFPFRKMDDAAVDGQGHIYAPARYDDMVLRLDSETLTEQARWPVGCHVSKMRYQASTKRLLGACQPENHMFFALDPSTGKVTARVPIGRTVDGFGIDEQRHRIVTSNGADANLTVIRQNSADDYELLGTVSTRPGARMMYMDDRNGRLYVVASTYTDSKPDASGDTERSYHPNSFVVLTYKPI